MKKLFLIIIVGLTLFLAACTDGNGKVQPLYTPYTDALTLDVPYESSSFINQGIGEVTLDLCIDGDTARFREGSVTFSVRFLGINTPESTGRIEPWGKSASDFVCDKLTNADTIVLEADPNRERIDSTGNRYLGYIWYDGRLLNLEVIEQAYSNAIGVIGLKYGLDMYDAWTDTQPTRRRIHGETDPDYDYEALAALVTIEELVKNPEAYMGRYLTVDGIITRTEGGHPWIQEGDYGIYLYRGFEFTTRLEMGNEVRITKLQLAYWPDPVSGGLQLTNLFRFNIELISTDNVVEPHRIEVDELNADYVGSLVSFENLTLKQTRSGNEFTLIAEDDYGNEIQIRKNSRSTFSFDVGVLTQGTRINITGPIQVHQGQLQIVITRLDDVEILD